MTIAPIPATPEEATRVSAKRPRVAYDWSQVPDALGVLLKAHDLPDDTTTEDATAACNRVKVAAYTYARKQGYRVRTRRERGGRTFWLTFTAREV